MRQADLGACAPSSFRIIASVGLLALATGCQGASPGEETTRAVTADGGGAAQLVERDVEAPEVFHTEDSALWDGRPSLGGIWVAAPDVTEPERVIMRNPDNGKTVIGALFRRERDNSGPPLQLSSEAADALGILAGSPTAVDITALRQAEVAEAPAVAAVPAGDTADADVAAPTATAAAEAPRRGGFLSRLFGRPAQATSATVAPPITSAEVSEIASSSLDAAPQAAPVSSLARPFVQIGTFTVETNAREAARAMTDAGRETRVEQVEGDGRPVWRVTVGPAANEDDRSAILREANALGFSDAFATGE